MKSRTIILIIAAICLIGTGCSLQPVKEPVNEKGLAITSISTSIGGVDGDGDSMDRQQYSYSFYLQNNENADLLIWEVQPVLNDGIKEKMKPGDHTIMINQVIPAGKGLEIKGNLIFDSKGMSKEEIIDLEPFIASLKITEERSLDFLHKDDAKISTPVPDRAMADAYIKALDQLLEEDPALNHEMKFIAVDMATFPNLKEADQTAIVEYFSKKSIEVRNTTMDELKKAGEFDENSLSIKNGILIRVDKVNQNSDKELSFEASKYKSGLGAIGMTFRFVKSRGKWVMKESRSTWIS